MANPRRSHRNILFSTALIVVATVLAGLAGTLMLARYNHDDFHDSLTRTVGDRADRLETVVSRQLVASAQVFDEMDKTAFVRGWLRGSAEDPQTELRRVYSTAKQAQIASMTVVGRDGRFFAAIGDAPRARMESVPLTGTEHSWLYWNSGWWIEHRLDIIHDGIMVGQWIAQLQVTGLYDMGEQPQALISGATLAVCAPREGEYPCLSMPPGGRAPDFYLGESAFCLTPDCTRGGEEAFNQTHELITGYRSVEGFEVVMVYSVPLADFFSEQQSYERLVIFAVLGVALTGLWIIYRQARPIARDLVRTTVHMQEIMSKLPESVVTVTASGSIRTANPATESMFGYGAEELIGRPIGLIVPEPQGLLQGPKRHGGPAAVLPAAQEVLARHRDGTAFPVELVTGEYHFERERHIIGIMRDVRERKRNEERLRKWAHIFEHAEWGVVVCSGAGETLEMMNPAFARMHGYRLEELAGRPVSHILAPESHAELAAQIHRADTGGHHSWEARHVRRDGSTFFGLIDITAVRDAHGAVAYRVMNIRDITTRKEAEEALRSNEARLANAQRIARLGDWEWDIHGGGLKWSEETWRLLGYAPGAFEPTYDAFLEAVAEGDRGDVRAAVNYALKTRTRYDVDYRIRRADGEERIFHEEGEVVCDRKGRPVRMVGTMQDVTEMKQRQLELEQQRVQLRELAANRETVREQERTRIAREIHDELGQSLTTLRMKAALIGIGLGEGAPELARQIDAIKALIDQNIVTVRNVAAKLRPGALDLGIVSAIEWLAQDFEERTGILCGIDIDRESQEIEFDDERATMVFRILQESLTNVARHAGASHVEISLSAGDGCYLLKVSDNGEGFEAARPGARKTFGLLGIRERATVLGGKVAITSRPGQGTTLELRIPALTGEER